MDPFTYALAEKADSLRRAAVKPAAHPFRSRLRQAAEADAETAKLAPHVIRNSFGYPVLPAAS